MICDKNCFECKFYDCIRQETADDNERVSKYRNNHPDRIKVQRAIQYQKHRNKELEYQRRYYKTHRNDADFIQKNRDRSKKWADENRERKRQMDREYAANHREEARLRSKLWREKKKAEREQQNGEQKNVFTECN